MSTRRWGLVRRADLYVLAPDYICRRGGARCTARVVNIVFIVLVLYRVPENMFLKLFTGNSF